MSMGKGEKEVKKSESNNGVKRVKITETDKVIGNIVVLYRNNQKLPARIISVNLQTHRIYYEYLFGPLKGKKYNSMFDSGQKVDVYNDENSVLAFLEV